MPQVDPSRCAVAVLGLVLVAAQRWVGPVGTPSSPYGSNEVHQMAYDPDSRSLYLANDAHHTILQVAQATTLTLTPLSSTPWGYSVVAGIDGVSGPPSPTEEVVAVAAFNYPTGVVGWPWYAVGPNTTSVMSSQVTAPVVVPAADAWVGLWVADHINHAIRFIHFYRNRNVTLVAGSFWKNSGATDGIGMLATLSKPMHLAWGRWRVDSIWSLSSPVRNASSMSSVPSAVIMEWTSVVYWSEDGNNCIRQGIPLLFRTMPGGAATTPYWDTPTEAITVDSLKDMVLNVSSFAGICNNGGGAVGLAYKKDVVSSPFGVALVNPFVRSPSTASSSSLQSMNSTLVLFVGDFGNSRLVMIAPMYPRTVRFLTVIASVATSGSFCGVTIGRMILRSGVDEAGGGAGASVPTYDSLADVQLFVGTYGVDYRNIPFSLHFHSRDGAVSMVAAASTTVSVMTTTILHTYCMVLLPYVYTDGTDGTMTIRNGTLVVMSGYVGSVFQFYCCLGAEYSSLLVLSEVVIEQEESTSKYQGKGTTKSRTRNASMTLSVRSGVTPTLSDTFMTTTSTKRRNNSPSATRSVSSCNISFSVVVLRGRTRALATRSRILRIRNASGVANNGPSSSMATFVAAHTATWVLVASSTVAGLSTSVVLPG